jgi:protein KTI12
MKELLAGQSGLMAGDKVPISSSDVPVLLSRVLTLSELRRIRRQFTTYTKTHPIDQADRIATAFVGFINATIF